MKKHKFCLVCSSSEIVPLKNYYEKHELVKCKACGFIFMENIPTEKELNDYYSSYSYTSDGYLSPITIQSYNILLDEFEKFRKTNKILDIGCGRGWFLQVAKERGWEVYGTEYSEEAIKIGKENGLQISSGMLNHDTFPVDNFDVITSFEVIEHINNPLDETVNIHKFLRKGGLFYCTTPNFNSYLRYYLKENFNIIGYPEHLSYYTRNTIKKLFKKQGFEISKVLTTGISITRFKTSIKPDSEMLISTESSDEKLRIRISNSWFLRVMKKNVDFILTKTGLGMSLKGYFIKK